MVNKLTIDYVRSKLLEEGYILLSETYEGSMINFKFKCNKGHINTMHWNSWSQGNRCSKCSGNAKMTLKQVKHSFELEGYTLLEDIYVNAHTKLNYVCPSGHKSSMTWSNWNHKRKFRCPRCSNRVSKQEKEIQVFITSLGINFKGSCRKIIRNPHTGRPLEFDIWIPDLNIAIEFNGDYWHSTHERVKCDLIKQQLCKENNIPLLIIIYSNWIKDKNKCKQKIKEFINARNSNILSKIK